MEKGLLWLPLLVFFFWLAWQGWNEYQKVEAYQTWAQQFDRAKYDIYAVLGEKDSHLTWGKPTRNGPVNLQTFSLNDVKDIYLLIDEQPIDMQSIPKKAKSVALEFAFLESANTMRIPFTEIELATKWGKHLQQELQNLRAKSS